MPMWHRSLVCFIIDGQPSFQYHEYQPLTSNCLSTEHHPFIHNNNDHAEQKNKNKITIVNNRIYKAKSPTKWFTLTDNNIFNISYISDMWNREFTKVLLCNYSQVTLNYDAWGKGCVQGVFHGIGVYMMKPMMLLSVTLLRNNFVGASIFYKKTCKSVECEKKLWRS